MHRVAYAGDSVITTDDVAAALIVLSAAVSRDGEAEAISIPILVDGTSLVGEADLVIGVGSDVLSAPVVWDADEPDFSEAAQHLREHRRYPRPVTESDDRRAVADAGWDYEFDGFVDES
jgi:hypothetical protein